jgi:EAL domain-containing protein (putative c-di-GMP-specific phosphodiesterase class I)
VDGIEIQAALQALGNPRALIDRIVGEALTLIPSADGSVVELAEDDLLRYAWTSGTLSPHAGLRLPMAGSLSGLSVRLGATLRCDDTEIDTRVDREACRRVAARSMVCVPLQCGGRNVGVLKVSSANAKAFSDRDVETLAGLASFIGAIVTVASQLGDLAGEWQGLSGAPDDVAWDMAGTAAFIAKVLRPGVIPDLEVAQQVEGVLSNHSFHIVHQAIVELRTGDVVASEALSRFDSVPARTPDAWFHDAWRVGLGPELELAAAAAALQDLDRLPSTCRLAINVSPGIVERPELAPMLATVDGSRVVLEVTEHMEPEDFERTRRHLDPLRRRGVKVAMDDAGSGFSGLSRLIELAPDIIKLDRAIIEGIDLDPVRRSLATAIVAFARDVGAVVIAEGVETEDELDAVGKLGIEQVQGYLLGRPGSVEDLLRVSGIRVASASGSV